MSTQHPSSPHSLDTARRSAGAAALQAAKADAAAEQSLMSLEARDVGFLRGSRYLNRRSLPKTTITTIPNAETLHTLNLCPLDPWSYYKTKSHHGDGP